MRSIVALLAAVLVVASVVAPAALLAAPTAAQDDVPRGMVGLPSSNVNDNVPDHAQAAGAPTADDFQGSVMTSRHAESLSVQVTTRASLQGRENACLRGQTPEWCGSPEVALVLEDTANHDGRTVSVPKRPVVENLGRVPEIVYIEHSSGDEYTAEVTDTGDQLAFRVEEFSTNTVTFSGTVELSGDPAANGTQYQYNLTDVDSVANYTIDVTGTIATADKLDSGTATPTDTPAIDVRGNMDATGPASGSPELRLTGRSYLRDYIDVSCTAGVCGVEEPDPPATIENVTLQTTNTHGSNSRSGTVEVNIGSETWSDSFVQGSSSTAERTLEIGEHVDGRTVTVNLSSSENGDIRLDGYEIWEAPPGSVDVTIDGTATTYGEFTHGQQKSNAVSLSPSTTEMDFSGNATGKLDWELDYTERAETEDPTVEVNGHTTGYSGRLSNGQTETLTTDSSWIVAGENRVNVTTGSADGLETEVSLAYSHDADDQMDVQYDGETWSERYNISRVYQSDQSAAQVTIPFASSRVVSVRDVETRVNDGAWSTVAESDRSFDGSELTVDLGAVAAGDEVAVRANASKVRVYNGAITVLEPTVEGDDLDTRVEFTSWGADAYIDVSGTSPDNHLHHAESESWSSPAEYAVVRSDDTQELYAPGASSGSTARVVTIPMDVDTTGDVRIEVESAGFNPTFDVHPGGSAGDSVTWTWAHPDLVTGQTYILYSDSAQVMVDSDEAQSPVLFESSDDDQTLSIFSDDGDGGSSTDGGGGSGMWADASSVARDYVPILDAEIVAILALLMFAVGAAYSERRSPKTTVYRRPFFATGALAALAFAVLFLAPQAVFNPLETALQAALPLLALGGVGFAGLIAYGWYKARQQSSEPPTIQVMGRNK